MKAIRVFALVLLLFNGIPALLGGYGLLADPSGAGVGMSLNYLEHAPFSDFLIPGLVLFSAIGVFSLVAAYALLRRWRDYPALVLLEGMVLVGWIGIQMLMLREVNGLHATYGTVGLLLIWAGVRLQAERPGDATPRSARFRLKRPFRSTRRVTH